MTAHVLATFSESVGSLDGFQEALVYVAVAMLVAADAICPFLPGETTVITAATIASRGDLQIVFVFLAAWIGAFGGDMMLYGIGRLGSERITHWATRMAGERRLETARYVFGRYGAPFVILGRFVPGLRAVVALTAGSLEMPFRRYLPIELIGSALWALYASWLGYAVGSQLDGQVWISVLVSFVVTAVLASVAGIIYKRLERDRVREAATAAESTTPPSAAAEEHL